MSGADSFDAVTLPEWRQRVDKELSGADFERALVRRDVDGLRMDPLYASLPPEAGDELPPGPPFRRGHAGVSRTALRLDRGPWHDAASVLDPALLEGVDVVWLTSDALRGATAKSLAHAVPEGRGLVFELGADTIAGAALASAAGRASDVLAIGTDPVGALARFGRARRPLERARREMLRAAEWADKQGLTARTTMVDTAAFHEAGASLAFEIACSLSGAVFALRTFDEAGVSLEAAKQRIGFFVALDSDVFVTIAKVRALRSLWSAVLQASSETPVAPFIAARTSPRSKARRDAHNNLLRATAETFAGICGGADVVATAPLDEPFVSQNAHWARIARNTQLIMKEEAHLMRTADPAGGSYAVETLTSDFARAAWTDFQALEREGGIYRALIRGTVAARIREHEEERKRRLSKGKQRRVGVNEYPPEEVEHVPDVAPLSLHADGDTEAVSPLGEHADGTDWVDTLSQRAERGVRYGRLVAALRGNDEGEWLNAPLALRRDAEMFEELAGALSGEGPVCLVNLGRLAEHLPRTTFMKNALGVGGVSVLETESIESDDASDAAKTAASAVLASGARVACLCASDARYETHAVAVARALADAGATRVAYAGRPGGREAALREAGVEVFFFLGADIPAALMSLMAKGGA